jgi:hypothetical protein
MVGIRSEVGPQDLTNHPGWALKLMGNLGKSWTIMNNYRKQIFDLSDFLEVQHQLAFNFQPSMIHGLGLRETLNRKSSVFTIKYL